MGTFNWYLPAATLEDFNECMECLDEKSLLEQFTSNILEEFLNLERIDFSDIPKVKDIIIGFAVKERDDFHFIRRGRNFQWYHKRGNLGWIERFEGSLEGNWYYRYPSEKVWFRVLPS